MIDGHLPTGIVALDKLLGGGLRASHMTLIYGEASTGKTTLSIHAAIQASMRGYKTVYLDVDGSFEPRRFSHIFEANDNGVGEKIIIFTPNSFREQTQTIENLPNYMTKSTKLVVVDTVTTLYRLESSSEERFTLNRELARQLAYLSEMASEYNLVILLTSQVHEAVQSNIVCVEPVAKRILFHWPNTIIRLNRRAPRGEREAILERSLNSPSRSRCTLTIG